MLDPRELYEIDPDLPDLTGAVLIHQLAGFLDAGDAGEGVTRHLLTELDHRVIARFDVDQLIDYRSKRPTMVFASDRWAAYDAPELLLYLLHDADGRPFLLLTGREPDLQWERFAAAIGVIGTELRIGPVIGVHGIPMGTPHTRRLGVTAHATRESLIQAETGWQPSRLQVPGSVSALLEFRLGQGGHDALGFAVHVPHYLAESTYPAATATLLESIRRATGLRIPDEKLRQAARAVNDEVDAQVRASDEISGVVEALERQYDLFTESARERNLLVDTEEDLPTADEIGNRFEQFLAEQTERPD